MMPWRGGGRLCSVQAPGCKLLNGMQQQHICGLVAYSILHSIYAYAQRGRPQAHPATTCICACLLCVVNDVDGLHRVHTCLRVLVVLHPFCTKDAAMRDAWYHTQQCAQGKAALICVSGRGVRKRGGKKCS